MNVSENVVCTRNGLRDSSRVQIFFAAADGVGQPVPICICPGSQLRYGFFDAHSSASLNVNQLQSMIFPQIGQTSGISPVS